MPDMRRPCCCAVCDEPLYEPKTVWPAGHPMAGWIRKPGKRLPIGKTITVALYSGGVADISLCDDCEPTPKNLVTAWSKICALNAFITSDAGAMAIGAAPHANDDARVWMHQCHRLLMLNVPLGELKRDTQESK